MVLRASRVGIAVAICCAGACSRSHGASPHDAPDAFVLADPAQKAPTEPQEPETLAPTQSAEPSRGNNGPGDRDLENEDDLVEQFLRDLSDSGVSFEDTTELTIEEVRGTLLNRDSLVGALHRKLAPCPAHSSNPHAPEASATFRLELNADGSVTSVKATSKSDVPTATESCWLTAFQLVTYQTGKQESVLDVTIRIPASK
jgi:hypothetical protein